MTTSKGIARHSAWLQGHRSAFTFRRSHRSSRSPLSVGGRLANWCGLLQTRSQAPTTLLLKMQIARVADGQSALRFRRQKIGRVVFTSSLCLLSAHQKAGMLLTPGSSFALTNQLLRRSSYLERIRGTPTTREEGARFTPVGTRFHSGAHLHVAFCAAR